MLGSVLESRFLFGLPVRDAGEAGSGHDPNDDCLANLEVAHVRTDGVQKGIV